jgi:hypothetical protein
MQYWLYAFKWGKGNVLIGKYETYEEANLERDRLDPEEYEYADIVETDWQKEPRIISSYSFEYRKKEKVLRRKYER